MGDTGKVCLSEGTSKLPGRCAVATGSASSELSRNEIRILSCDVLLGGLPSSLPALGAWEEEDGHALVPSGEDHGSMANDAEGYNDDWYVIISWQ